MFLSTPEYNNHHCYPRRKLYFCRHVLILKQSDYGSPESKGGKQLSDVVRLCHSFAGKIFFVYLKLKQHKEELCVARLSRGADSDALLRCGLQVQALPTSDGGAPAVGSIHHCLGQRCVLLAGRSVSKSGLST